LSRKSQNRFNYKQLITVSRKVLIVNIFLLCHLLLFSQHLTKKEFIKAVQEADTYFYYEQDYEKAASLYQPLVNAYPDNSNLASKLGMCNLNIDGKKADALRYLKAASGNIARNDDEYTEYGESAPLDTYLYIALAYQQNDSLDKAVILFTEAKKRLAGYDVFNTEYINNQIKNCKYAMEVKKKPLDLKTGLLIPWLADFPGAANPVISKNDSVFVFTHKQNGKTRILCSYKVADKWKKPSDITKQLGGLDRYYSNSITGDGRTLIIYMDDGRDGNLYSSQRKDSTWSKIRNLGKEINTIYWEAHGFITPDGKTLYISSNKPGGIGELDIWISEKDKDGSWKKPVNCGSVINTPYNENTPFFDPDSGTLLFSSSGHTGMGGYDVFRSFFKRSSWSHPAGLPFPVNKTIDDSFFIFNNRDTGFITSYYDESTGNRNIYTLKTGEPVEKRITAEGIGFRPVDLPSNWIWLHPGLRTKIIESIYSRCEKIVRKFTQKILSGKKVYRGLFSIPVDLLISPISLGYYAGGRFFLAKTFMANNNCNNCGLCIRECPTSSIKLVNKRPYWKLTCESCMRCLNQCPEKAIESAHGMAIAFWIIFTAVNTEIILLIINTLNISPKSWWWWIVSNIISIGGMVLITAVLYYIMHYAMGIKPVRYLVRFTSLTTLPFWRRYNYFKERKYPSSSTKSNTTS